MLTFARFGSLAFLIMSAVFPRAFAAAPNDHKVIEIWPEGVPGIHADATPDKVEDARVSGVHRPTLTVYPAPASTANGAAVIICPGGGYVRLSIENEGSLVAEWLNSIGVTAYVLRYRMVEYGHPAPLRDVLRAVRLVRSEAKANGLDPDRIGVFGASAGGHLAASSGTLFDDPDGKTGAKLDSVSARPDFLILLYPVITLKAPLAHAGSRLALLGKDATPEMIERFSLESRVIKKTPPTFIAVTEDDKTVPVENSLMFYQALRTAGVPAELHIWPKGTHGFGMKKDLGGPSTWPSLCESWLRSNEWLPTKK